MMIRRFLRPASAVALSLMGALVIVPATFAAAPQNITMSPSSSLVSVKAGETTTKSFTIVNSGDSEFAVAASVSPYHVEGVNYDPQFSQLPGTVDAAAWVTLKQTKFTLAPHAVNEVSYSVHAPAGTPPGGYYAVVFAQTDTTPDAGTQGVVLHNRVGNILYITVEGPVHDSGKIEDVHLPSIIIGTAVTIGTKVSNTGGIHFLSTFKTQVTSFTGHKAFVSTIDRYVLPQTTREVPTTWMPSSIIGYYKVSRSATVAGTEKSLPDTWIVVIKPPFFPIVGFGVLTIIGLFFTLRHNRHQRQSSRKRSKPSKHTDDHS